MMKLICNSYIRNYGSVLQSYATYKTLAKYDPSVKVINYVYIPSKKARFEIAVRIRVKYMKNLDMLGNKIKKIITKDTAFKEIKAARGIRFDSFLKEKINFTLKYESINEILNDLKENEILVIGSDQLWGPEDIICNYHTLSWVNKNVKLVAYATSFGVTELPKYLERRATAFLNNINEISVREESGVKIVEKLIGKKVPQVCDPTLLLSEEEWSKIASNNIIESGYIFCFFIGNNPIYREYAKQLRNKTGLKIVSIQHLDQYIQSDEGYADKTYNDASPEEFLNLIRNAKYVLCDSFHATIFSILFERQFVIFNRYDDKAFGSRNSRIDSICKRLGLTERRFVEGNDLKAQLDSEIDYVNVKNCIDEWRKESLGYLENAIAR